MKQFTRLMQNLDGGIPIFFLLFKRRFEQPSLLEIINKKLEEVMVRNS